MNTDKPAPRRWSFSLRTLFDVVTGLAATIYYLMLTIDFFPVWWLSLLLVGPQLATTWTVAIIGWRSGAPLLGAVGGVAAGIIVLALTFVVICLSPPHIQS